VLLCYYYKIKQQLNCTTAHIPLNYSDYKVQENCSDNYHPTQSIASNYLRLQLHRMYTNNEVYEHKPCSRTGIAHANVTCIYNTSKRVAFHQMLGTNTSTQTH